MSLARRLGLGATLIAAACVYIVFVSSPVLQDVAIFTCYWLLLGASWNMIAGFCGQFSFAHIGLAGAGGYLAIFAEQNLHVSAGPAIPLAGLMTAAVGFVLGMVSTRVRGIYLALITFAFGGAFVAWALGATITGGVIGHESALLFSGIDARGFLWVGFTLVVVYFLFQSLILDSRFGLEAMAVRDREEVAEGLGVRTKRVKVTMFTYTAFWAGVAGAFYAGYVGIIAPPIADLINMGFIVAVVVVGGMGRRLGPVAGVLLLQFIDYRVRTLGTEYTMLIFSGLVLAFMLFARNGLLGLADATLLRFRAPRARWQPESEAVPAHLLSSRESEEPRPAGTMMPNRWSQERRI